MILDRWRAQRAIRTRSAPTSVKGEAPAELLRIVGALKDAVDASTSLGDPHWHQRWEGALQLVGLDARSRSTTDVRQRLVRLHHELSLRHLSRACRRVLAVLLVEPRADEDLRAWHARLDDERGEVGEADWRAARRSLALLLVGPDGEELLVGGDRALRRALEGRPGVDA